MKTKKKLLREKSRILTDTDITSFTEKVKLFAALKIAPALLIVQTVVQVVTSQIRYAINHVLKRQHFAVAMMDIFLPEMGIAFRRMTVLALTVGGMKFSQNVKMPVIQHAITMFVRAIKHVQIMQEKNVSVLLALCMRPMECAFLKKNAQQIHHLRQCVICLFNISVLPDFLFFFFILFKKIFETLYKETKTNCSSLMNGDRKILYV